MPKPTPAKVTNDSVKADMCERATTTMQRDTKGRMTFKVDQEMLAQCEAITTAKLLELEKRCMDQTSGLPVRHGIAPFDACMQTGIPTLASTGGKAR